MMIVIVSVAVAASLAARGAAVSIAALAAAASVAAALAAAASIAAAPAVAALMRIARGAAHAKVVAIAHASITGGRTMRADTTAMVGAVTRGTARGTIGAEGAAAQVTATAAAALPHLLRRQMTAVAAAP